MTSDMTKLKTSAAQSSERGGRYALVVDLGGQQGGPGLPLDQWGGREGERPELLWGLLGGTEVQLHEILGHIKACQPACHTKL